MSNDLVKHYQSLLAQHGDSSESLQHFDKTSQSKRFEVLTSHISETNYTLLDIGCGLGHILEYLDEGHRGPTAYLGIDIVPEFIELANKKYASRKGVQFSQINIQTDVMNTSYDHVVICGIFNNILTDNWTFIFETLDKAFKLTNTSLSFNLLSTYVDFQAPNLFYADPLRVFDFCKKNLSRKIDIQNAYLLKEGSIPYEYTMKVYR